MAVESPPRTIWLFAWIDMQNDLRNLAPIGALSVCIEQSQICHNMFMIICRQGRRRWGQVSDIGIERRLLHGHAGARGRHEEITHIH